MADPKDLFSTLSETVNLIENDSIREFTKAMIDKAPAIVWERAASTRYHLLDERGDYGNLLHTIRVVSLCKVIMDAVEVAPGNTSLGRDVLLSAALLHDICRHGLFGLDVSTRTDHPDLVLMHARQYGLTCDCFDDIMSTIGVHMGKWSPRPVSFTIDADLALHLADYIATHWTEVMNHGRT